MNSNNSLQQRARFYAHVLSILFQHQRLAGGRLKTASRAARHLSLGLRLSDPTEIDKAMKLAEPLALAANCENVLAGRQYGLLVYQFQLARGFWQSYTRADLPSPRAVGLAERRQPIEFDFTYPHALVAGSTGSGKSEAIKSILISLMTIYRPQDLSIVLCDLHGDYQDFENEAHLLLPTVASQDEVDNALRFISQKLAYRKAENIKDDALLLLVMDEASEILATEERFSIIKSVAQEGRKFRVHLLVGTPKPSHKDLPGVFDLLNNRFVGYVSDGRVSANVTGRSGLEAHKLTGQGDFIHVAGLDVQRFQVAQATRLDFDRLERAEIKPVAVEPDLVILPDPPEKKPGRPRLEVQPELAAWYHFFDNQISLSQARDRGLSRKLHALHKAFVETFVRTQNLLQQGGEL